MEEASPSTPGGSASGLTGSPSMAPEWELESVGPDGKPTAVPAHLYIQRVAAMHADGDVGFSREFENVHTMAAGADADNGNREEGEEGGGSLNIEGAREKKAGRGKSRFSSKCECFYIIIRTFLVHK